MALISIDQDDFERVIKFGFAKKPGDQICKYLIFELMGKHSNIFYLDNKHKIIAVGKQIKSSQSSFRTISTGSIYSDLQSISKNHLEKMNLFNHGKTQFQ